MRLFNYIFLILFSTLMLSSCTTERAVVRTAVAAESKVIQKTLVADVKVNVSIKLRGTGISENGTEKHAKDLANWNALASSDATILIDPVYTITRDKKTYTAHVTGFHGVYENIETATEIDLLNYIRFVLLSGTGILSVTFDQFSAYYYKLIVDETDEYIMTEEELLSYYNEQVFIAEMEQKRTYNSKKN